jgi:hypothetical protein
VTAYESGAPRDDECFSSGFHGAPISPKPPIRPAGRLVDRVRVRW